ncbi:SURF1 family cytochrome oxidase biogenesis protein [Gordonia sp. LSe1-13]|uniref:SURF1-like protein n=1 Tax=Gordonia sesuvii TaxID=3116777 RepID=A0ABU7MIH5_9ACTN|nr:SURF1 family cytochrome oxidase biogenesis protein [Gordonia sp. LSe1-13]
MHVVRTFLRPGWLALGVVVVAFAAMCFTLLAPWQLGKSSDTEERNDLIEAAMTQAPVPIDDVAAPGAPFDPSTEWREVTLTGRYLTDREVAVRLRSVEERPAVEVLTPFAVEDGSRVVLVDRGYVRPEQDALPPIPAAPSEVTTIEARIREGEGTSPGRGAHSEADTVAVYTIDPAEVGRAVDTDLDPFYLQLSPDQPGSLGEIPLPQLDSGPYLSYGLQWLAFGIMAPLGAGYFIYAEIRQRRRAGQTATDTATSGDDRGDGSRTPARPDASPASRGRRGRVRADLRDAGAASGSRQRHQVGSGPDAETADDDVRAKLTHRYGG